MMTDKFHTHGQFNQNWPNYHPMQPEWDDVDVEIVLQDILCPSDEMDLDIAKDMLTRIGIQC